jgi:beta-N-acetylhexosaminidase
MITHLINRQLDPSGLPSTFSKAIITGLLVGKMHYTGLIITDDMDAAAIRKYFSTDYAIDKAVLAGNDIIIYGGSQGQDPDEDTRMLFSTLMKFAKKDPIFRKRVAESYQKIIRLKRNI